MHMPEQYFHFTLNELDVDVPSVGDIGEITIKVEVTGIDKEGVSLTKHGPVKVTRPFKEMDLEHMKQNIGIVEDEEEPMHKEKTKDTDD